MAKLFNEPKKHYTTEEKIQREDAKKALSEQQELTSVPPAWLPDSGKTEWKRVLPLLKEELPIAEADYSMLVSYCALFARIRTCEGDIRKNGHFIVNEEANTKKANPAVAMQSQAIRDMKSVATSLCMTLDSRSRLALASTKDEKDDFESLMSE